jgi:hypothetical protein
MLSTPASFATKLRAIATAADVGGTPSQMLLKPVAIRRATC